MKNNIPELLEKIAQLEDEVSSLWSMLEEMKNSDVRKHRKALEKAHLEVVAERLLKDKSRVDA